MSSTQTGEQRQASKPELGANGRIVLWIAWAVTLAVSALPDIVYREWAGGRPGWLPDARLALPVGLAAAGFVWRPLRPLSRFALLLLALLLVEQARGVLEASPRWREWFTGGFGRNMLGIQILRVWAGLVIIGALYALRFRPGDRYVSKGDLAAPAQPVRWLGIDGSVRWDRLGPISAACIGLGTLAFLVIAGRPSASALAQPIPLIPLILVLAAMNAWGEEVVYRSSLLAPLAPLLGPRQAVLLTAVFFGIGHFYGIPYGIAGVAMSGLLGWFLGKCMVETRGLFWPWFIHFVQDMAIFYFMAANAVVPGGR